MQQLMEDRAGNVWSVSPDGTKTFVSSPKQAAPLGIGLDPNKQAADRAGLTGKSMDNQITEATLPAVIRKTNAEADIAEGKRGDSKMDNTVKLRSAFDNQQGVKDYREAIGRLASGLKTANNPQGDNALIYAYAKMMDPGATVQVSEAAGISGSDTAFGRAYAYAQKQLNNTGTFSPEARAGLRREMISQGVSLNRSYEAQRERYADDAKAFGLDPARVIGKHDGSRFLPDIQGYARSQRKADPSLASAAEAAAPRDGSKTTIYDPNNGQRPGDAAPPTELPDVGYADSYVSQGLSGINDGIANIAGAPVDLVTGAINLGTRGINAVANTRIPSIDNPLLGSQSIKNGMGWLGATAAPTNDPGKQFVRRVGESVGSAVPFAAGANTLLRGGSALAAAAGGGVGAAGAQQAFPGNPLAEMVGEVAGGGLTGAGLLGAARRNTTRQIEAAVPSVDQLREQAGGLYRAAEARGVTADPTMTQNLADNFRAALVKEGKITPDGVMSDVYPKAKEAMRVIDAYAGNTMNPTQMQTIRSAAADGLTSMEPTERRLGSILTDAFDEWSVPQAPELAQARNVASRYLTAEQLQQARELAASKANQYSGSGFENALRREYGALDRGAIRGSKRFSEDVTGAIETVARGTPSSNRWRALGKYAPTGVVPSALGGGGAAALFGTMGGPLAGVAAGGIVAGAGTLGRNIATRQGLRAADQAELIARNGGALPTPSYMSPEDLKMIQWLASGQSANYLEE